MLVVVNLQTKEPKRFIFHVFRFLLTYISRMFSFHFHSVKNVEYGTGAVFYAPFCAFSAVENVMDWNTVHETNLEI